MTDHSTSVLKAPSAISRSRDSRKAELIGLSLLAGLLIAMLWSAQLVDDDIGVNSANGLLGHNSEKTAIAGSAAGAVFALVAGLAGTFTACNVAVFSAIAPMMPDAPSLTNRLKLALKPVIWLTVGACVVTAIYGAVGVALGSRLPQLSTRNVGGTHVAVRVLQSIGVFSAIGLVMIYLGLAAADAVPDPMRRLSARFPHARELVMGVLIGGFLIGRPYPLFFKMFQYAASTHDPLYGSLSLVLIVLGNILLMAVIFLLLSLTRFPRWLTASPGRAARFTAAALLVGGAFTFVYWGVRLPAHLGYGWFPTMPWH